MNELIVISSATIIFVFLYMFHQEKMVHKDKKKFT